MPFSAPRPIISGQPYSILPVGDRRPVNLSDFVGSTAFVLDVDGDAYAVCGTGVAVGNDVHVYEKDAAGAGKDIRVWTIRPQDPGPGFLAEHTPIN